MSAAGAGFPGFGPAAFAFLRGLASNQSKAWFEANRATYQAELQSPCMALAEIVAAEYARLDLPLTGDAKRSTFRIHRDVRFSKDKSPYKTETGVVWMRPGFKKLSPGVAYLQVSDSECFFGAGFWEVEKPQLTALRDAIRDDGAGFAAAMQDAAAAGLELGHGNSLTRPPRGYEGVTEPGAAAALKARNLVVTRPVSKREMAGAGLVQTVVAATQAALPLLRFGWNAIAEADPPPDWALLG